MVVLFFYFVVSICIGVASICVFIYIKTKEQKLYAPTDLNQHYKTYEKQMYSSIYAYWDQRIEYAANTKLELQYANYCCELVDIAENTVRKVNLINETTTNKLYCQHQQSTTPDVSNVIFMTDFETK